MLIEDASEVVECGWNEEGDDETGLAVREISLDRDSSEWTKLVCISAKWDERDCSAVERLWKNAVSDRRGMTNSLASFSRSLKDWCNECRTIVCVSPVRKNSPDPLVNFFNRSRNFGSIGFAPGKNSYAASGTSRTSELYNPGITNPFRSEHSTSSLCPSRCCSSDGRKPSETSSSTTWLTSFFNWIIVRFWRPITVKLLWTHLSIFYCIFPQLRRKSEKKLGVSLWIVHDSSSCSLVKPQVLK